MSDTSLKDKIIIGGISGLFSIILAALPLVIAHPEVFFPRRENLTGCWESVAYSGDHFGTFQIVDKQQRTSIASFIKSNFLKTSSSHELYAVGHHFRDKNCQNNWYHTAHGKLLNDDQQLEYTYSEKKINRPDTACSSLNKGKVVKFSVYKNYLRYIPDKSPWTSGDLIKIGENPSLCSPQSHLSDTELKSLAKSSQNTKTNP